MSSDETQPAALSVEGLKMSYVVRGIPREVLRGVSFEVRPGEAYGLVGEVGAARHFAGGTRCPILFSRDGRWPRLVFAG